MSALESLSEQDGSSAALASSDVDFKPKKIVPSKSGQDKKSKVKKSAVKMTDKALIEGDESGEKDEFIGSSEEDLASYESSLSLDDIILDDKYFPRCEYYARFQGTTLFSMIDPKYWDTYFRSTASGGKCDRYAAKLTGQKISSNPLLCYDYKSKAVPKVGHTHTGSIKNIFTQEPYSQILLEPQDCTQITKGNKLYDAILKYKNNMCLHIVQKFDGLSKLVQVYHRHEYSCLIIHVDGLHGKSFYKALMAHYVAIVNNLAISKSISIELVIRSSFGHNNPTVSDTGDESFRINVGIMPKLYAAKLVEGLKELEKVIDSWKTEIIPDSIANKQKREVAPYNNQIKQANEDTKSKKKKGTTSSKKILEKGVVSIWKGKTLIEVLKSKGNAKGKDAKEANTVIAELMTRQRYYPDLLVDEVMQVLDKAEQPNYAIPLFNMLKKLTYKKNKNVYSVSLKYSDNDFQYNLAKREVKISKASRKIGDKEFWNIIKKINHALKISKESTVLQECCNNKDITNLYRALEKANHLFVRNSGNQEASNGVGSDSECEITYTENQHKKKFYSSKMIVGTGMKAVMLASCTALYYLTKNDPLTQPTINLNYMYFETADAIRFVANTFGRVLKKIPEKPKVSKKTSKKSDLWCIDLNHCHSTNFEDTKNVLDILTDIEIDCGNPIILDYTSAKSKLVREAILLCLQKTSIVLLVNSGLKNEQCGADMNPYGTFRIITKKSEAMIELYDFAIGTLLNNANPDIVPAVSHKIRKSYKEAGFVLRSEEIYKDLQYKSSSRLKEKEISKFQIYNDKNIKDKNKRQRLKYRICI